jgi:hypothetical protein
MSRDLRVHSVPSRAEQVRTAVEIVAIVAAGLWALYTFVYEQRIKPLSEAPQFSDPVSVDQGPTTNGVVLLTVHKRLENSGNVPIDIAAESLSVYGEKLDSRVRRIQQDNTATFVQMSADVPRRAVALLFSFAKLRSGAVGGDQSINFFVPPHSSSEETFVVAVPARVYPVIKIGRKDFIGKAPISPKISVRIVRTPMGAYELQSPQREGEYDTENEYPIRP